MLTFLICLLAVPTAASGEIIYRTSARPGSWEPFDRDGNGGLDFGFGVESKVAGPDQLSIYFAIKQAGGVESGNGVLIDGDGVPPLPAAFVIGPDPEGLTWGDRGQGTAGRRRPGKAVV